MTSTVPDEAGHLRPWGTAFALAGAMAAGLATGRRSKLALAAGVTALLGLKWMLRPAVVARPSPPEPRLSLRDLVLGGFSRTAPTDCCSGAEKSPEPELCAANGVAAGGSDGPCAVDEAIPAIWEQGWGDSVSRGAVGAQTVWFEWHDPAETIPAALFPEPSNLVALASLRPEAERVGGTGSPDGSSRGVSDCNLDSLPAIPAITGELGGGNPVTRERETAAPGELQPGPDRSGLGRPWILLTTAVLLVIVALALVLVRSQHDSWITGVRQRWQVAHRMTPEQPPQAAGTWKDAPAAPAAPEK